MNADWNRHQFVVPQAVLDERCPPALQQIIPSLSPFVRPYDVGVHPKTYQLLVSLAENRRFRLFDTLVIPTREGWGHVGRGIGTSEKAYPDCSEIENLVFNAALRGLLAG